MAQRRKATRRKPRRRVRRAYAGARRAVRRVARRRRRAPVAAAAPPRRRRRKAAPKRRRRTTRRPALPQMGVRIAAGVGGGVAAAALVNMAPIADNRSKALAATAAGLAGWFFLPKRQKVARYASMGAMLSGALSLTKQMFPQVPMLAGAEPYYMGVNMRPTYPAITNRANRARQYSQQKAGAFSEATRSGRNMQMAGAGPNRMSAGAQFGRFLTPADM